MKITINDGKAMISTPYNPEFVKRIKNAGGRWDASGKVWTVDAGMVDAAREIMRDVYGRDDVADVAMTDVRIRFTKEVSEWRDAIVIFGKTIAKAWHRDSGARVGDGVAFVSGAPCSGGSVKNWHTVIPEGCEVVLKDVPATLLGGELPEGAVIVSDADSKRESLMARKAELEAALAEIEAEIAAL